MRLEAHGRVTGGYAEASFVVRDPADSSARVPPVSSSGGADPGRIIGGVVAVAAAVLLVGCERDEGERLCPPLAAGDLVVTEISRAAGDEWIELYNATAAPIDLAGVRLRLRKLDGSGEQIALVRSETVVDAGGYATLGRGAPAAHVDYPLGGDFDAAIYESAAVELSSCETAVDTAVYRNLPSTGSWSLGTMPPSAVANDEPASWCADEGGTPQEENRPCP
jgi:lamin tail-like protein